MVTRVKICSTRRQPRAESTMPFQPVVHRRALMAYRVRTPGVVPPGLSKNGLRLHLGTRKKRSHEQGRMRRAKEKKKKERKKSHQEALGWRDNGGPTAIGQLVPGRRCDDVSSLTITTPGTKSGETRARYKSRQQADEQASSRRKGDKRRPRGRRARIDLSEASRPAGEEVGGGGGETRDVRWGLRRAAPGAGSTGEGSGYLPTLLTW